MTTCNGKTVLDFKREQDLICNGNWMLSRYYCDEGDIVRNFLSFNAVFEINPFEIGVNRRAQRKAHREKLIELIQLLDLKDLMPQSVLSLSNGEMRRVIFARALLKGHKRLEMVSPMAGLDTAHRKLFEQAIEVQGKKGFEISIINNDNDGNAPAPQISVTIKKQIPKSDRKNGKGTAVVKINNLTIRIGRKTLFKNLSWTIWPGERWLLCGPNGSGKTTLLALMTGDSPLAYAHDIQLFGIPRATGNNLHQVRSRIASVSPEMQAYHGKEPEELLNEALAQNPELLLLDEPCYNLDAKSTRKMLSTINRWLKKHPHVAAVCVAHRAHHVPATFNRIINL